MLINLKSIKVTDKIRQYDGNGQVSVEIARGLIRSSTKKFTLPNRAEDQAKNTTLPAEIPVDISFKL